MLDFSAWSTGEPNHQLNRSSPRTAITHSPSPNRKRRKSISNSEFPERTTILSIAFPPSLRFAHHQISGKERFRLPGVFIIISFYATEINCNEVIITKVNRIAYPNLRAEMGRKGMTIKDLSDAVSINRDTLSRKLSKKSPIFLREAIQIQMIVFPGMDVRYLFAEDGDEFAS